MLRSKWIIRLFALVGLLFLALLTLSVLESGDPVSRAIVGMTWGLVLLWVVLGGLLMRRFRDPIRQRVRRISLHWQVKFVLFAVLLALLEEAVTTGMTNLAPLFGVAVGEAYITASADYLDVVLFHSVIVFVPMFLAWALLLRRYDFSAAAVFLLFGLTGTLAETISFGLQSLLNVGLWVFVYGLMIYLPAYTAPPAAERGAKQVRFYHVPLALVFPILCSIPVVLLISQIHPVGIHFAPIP